MVITDHDGEAATAAAKTLGDEHCVATTGLIPGPTAVVAGRNPTTHWRPTIGATSSPTARRTWPPQ